jgi:hypothetical protein
VSKWSHSPNIRIAGRRKPLTHAPRSFDITDARRRFEGRDSLGLAAASDRSIPARPGLIHTEAQLTKKLIPLALGVMMATAATTSFAADLAIAKAPPPPEPVNPIVAIITLPITVAGAIVSVLLPPPPPPVVAKY